MLHIDLVKGNHDILDDAWYIDAGIEVHEEKMVEDPFIFVHDLKLRDKLDETEQQLYAFTGHMHPAISLRGNGRQSLRFPCFYFTKEYCVLPAFSRFSGTFCVSPEKDETVFAVVENALMQLP